MITILIVDDHALIRLGLRRLLEDVTEFSVIGEADSGEECLRTIRRLGTNKPDIILLDIRMPGMGGLETTRRLLKLDTNAKVIILTALNSEHYPSRVMQEGALGYLTKEAELAEMVTAIKKVNRYQRYITPTIAHQLALKSVSDIGHCQSPIEGLSNRELEVMNMIVTGQNVQTIADILCISSKTVNSYRYRLFKKLTANNDVELTHLALQYNLLDHTYLRNIKQQQYVTASEEH